MSPLRFVIVIPALVLTTGLSSGVTPDEIKAAVRKGVEYLQPTYQNATPAQIAEGADGLGPAALAGLALLEAGVPSDDPAVRAITVGIREAAFAETRTYQLTLGILFLDRLGEPADGPIIQLLGVRLLAGQNGRGGWTYGCVDTVPATEVSRLRKALTVAELKTERKRSPTPSGDGSAPAKPKSTAVLDPEIKKYAGRLVASQSAARGDDNSNTQFGTLGLWVARGHGVSVEAALERVERRFLTTQTANGGWAYTDFTPGTPSMTCAGLLGLATASRRRRRSHWTAGMWGSTASPRIWCPATRTAFGTCSWPTPATATAITVAAGGVNRPSPAAS